MTTEPGQKPLITNSLDSPRAAPEIRTADGPGAPPAVQKRWKKVPIAAEAKLGTV